MKYFAVMVVSAVMVASYAWIKTTEIKALVKLKQPVSAPCELKNYSKLR